MKLSKYNILVQKSRYSYWLNTLNFKFFRIESQLSDKITPLLDNLSILEESVPSLYQKLVTNGFIIKDDVDEIKIIHEMHNNAVNSKNGFLIIMPTLNCNYNCWYCIQNHIPSDMDITVLDLVKKHVDYLIHKKKIESLSIDWFGGEPLMMFDEIVEPLSKYMIEECRKANIPFRNGATTNGYYLPKLSGKLEALGFKRFQITLDGNKSNHDKVKFTDGCISTFNHVLTCINNALTEYKALQVTLRINYTHDNLSKSIIEEIVKFIDVENRPRAVIMPRKVWQERVDKSFGTVLDEILDLFAQEGFSVERWLPNADHVSCYSNRKNYCAICPDGHVVKCTACNDIYDPNTGGIILPDGSIEWKSDFDKKYTSCTFDNPRCLSCPRLPLCMGACPRDNNLGNTQCKYNFMDNSFEDSMVKYIDGIYQQREKNN